MPTHITKAVIPAAGLGKRLMPITCAVPKEMFPIGKYPAVQWVIAEAVAGGCTEIAVVVSPRKTIIKEYLTHSCHTFHQHCRLTFIDQPEPLGLGHALLLAEEFCGGEPVAVLLPDDLIAGRKLPLLQMYSAFRSNGGVIFALVTASSENPRWSERWHLHRIHRRLYAIQPRQAESYQEREKPRFVGAGRYLISPEVLDYAEQLFQLPLNGELDDGMIFEFMCDRGQPVHGIVVEGQRFDISTFEGYIGAWQAFGRSKPIGIFPPDPDKP